MIIQEISAVGLRGATPEGGWSEELKEEDCIHTLVFVDTDEGVRGLRFGFSPTMACTGCAGGAAASGHRPDRDRPERVSERLHQNTFWMGRGGSITHTISGIDIALWDILGKVTGQPVGRLLGGRYRERVRPYASLLMDQPAPLRDELQRWKEQGFRAFKMGWGPLAA